MNKIKYALFFCLLIHQVHGAISITGNVSEGTGVITWDSHRWTATESGNVQFLVFDDWVDTLVPGDRLTTGDLGTIRNLTTGEEVIQTRLFDNFNANSQDFTFNDGFTSLDISLTVAPGDVIFWEAGSAVLSASPGFNQPSNTFTGDVFLSNGSFLSAAATVVPEPSSSLLLVGGSLAYCLRRRR